MSFVKFNDYTFAESSLPVAEAIFSINTGPKTECFDVPSVRWCLYGENSLGYARLFFEARHRHPMQANTMLIVCLYVHCK